LKRKNIIFEKRARADVYSVKPRARKTGVGSFGKVERGCRITSTKDKSCKKLAGIVLNGETICPM